MTKVIALANQKGGVGKKNRPTMVKYHMRCTIKH